MNSNDNNSSSAEDKLGFTNYGSESLSEQKTNNDSDVTNFATTENPSSQQSSASFASTSPLDNERVKNVYQNNDSDRGEEW